MKNNKIEIKKKLTNHLMVCGKKNKGEKILLKSLKELQKSSDRQAKELLKLAIILSTPTFKLHRMIQKKKRKKTREIPAFIALETSRTSLAIKFILTTTRRKKSQKLYSKLKEEIILNAQNRGEAVKIKKELQKQALANKHFFSYFRWR